MKKFMAFLCSLILVFSVCFVSACGDENGDTNSNVVLASATNYLADMETTQSENGAVLVETEQLDDIMYLQYNIGQIKNCFVQNVMTPIYHDGSLNTIKYTENFVTSTTISKGFAKAVSTTESVSLTDSTSTALSWKVGASVSETAESAVGVNFGIVSATEKISATFTASLEAGTSTETTSSETISKSTIESVNNSYDVTYIEERCREVASEFDMSNYETGAYYALALVADITVYQIVAYSISTGTFYTSYFVSVIDESNTGLRMLSSPSTSFDIDSELQISPITDIDIDTAAVSVSDGSEEHPYLISYASQFVNIGQNLDACYQLTQDINFYGASISPIGGNTDFLGILDGNGYKIYNFTINSCNSNGNMGLFAVNSGTVKNLQIGDLETETVIKVDSVKDKTAGAVAGVNNGTIINCLINNVEVHCRKDDGSNSDASMKAGGVCGENRGSISRCSVLNSVVYAEGHATNKWVDSFAGGIAGASYERWSDKVTSEIVDCYVYNTSVSARAGINDGLFTMRTAKSVAGGLVGEADSGTAISYCVVGDTTETANSTTNFGTKTNITDALVAVNNSATVAQCVSGLDNGKYVTLISNNSSFGTRTTLNGDIIWIEGDEGVLKLAFESKE